MISFLCLELQYASLVFKIIKDNAQFITTSNKGFVTTSTTVSYNFVQFSTKSQHKSSVKLNLICLVFQRIEISDNRYFASSRKWP